MRTYGAILPSSLATVLSLTSGFSPCPPVSVLVRAAMEYTRNFSWKLATYASVLALRRSLTYHALHPDDAFHCHPAIRFAHNPFSGSYLPSPSFLHFHRGYRNICLFSIHYAFRPRVRSRLTQGGRTFPWNPWAIGVQDSHLHLATHTGILTSMRSTAPYGTASMPMERSPTQ